MVMKFFRRKPDFKYTKHGVGFAVERINRFTGTLTARTSQFGYVTGYRKMSWDEWDAIEEAS